MKMSTSNDKMTVSNSSSSTILPPPPIFKPTIIQMKGGSSMSNYGQGNSGGNSSNSNILTTLSSSVQSNESDQQSPTVDVSESPQLSPQLPPTQKRRRKSSQVVDQEEMAKKRRELKAAHSVIEKKRRIKMNREFEALKYMVPACRTSILQALSQPLTNSPSLTSIQQQQQQQGTHSRQNSISSDPGLENANQMHKLTILQSTVEYISYLHHVIQLQSSQLSKNDPNHSTQNDLSFTEFELDLDEYRDIEKFFDFNNLFKKLLSNGGQPLKFDQINRELKTDDPETNMSRSSSIPSTQLPSPLVTPNIDSKITSLNKYKLNNSAAAVTSASSLQSNQSRADFQLPLPMVSTKKKIISAAISPLMTSQQQQHEIPKALSGQVEESEHGSTDPADEASRVLLSIRDDKGKKSSISNLLN